MSIGIQTKKLEEPEVNPYIYGQLAFNKSTKIIQWGKNNFSTNGTETTIYPHIKFWRWTPNSQCMQKLTQIDQRPKFKC